MKEKPFHKADGLLKKDFKGSIKAVVVYFFPITM